MSKKKKGTVFDIAFEYLHSECKISEHKIVSILFESTGFEEPYFWEQQTYNIVSANKAQSPNSETGIDISTTSWKLFFTEEDINDFKHTGNRHQQQQNVKFFEANLRQMLDRRNDIKEKGSADKGSDSLTAIKDMKNIIGKYNKETDNIISCECAKWITKQTGSTHVKISQKKKDSTEFTHLRLGILKEDYLLMLKRTDTDAILVIAIPKEFVQDNYEVKEYADAKDKVTNSEKYKELKNTEIDERQSDISYIIGTLSAEGKEDESSGKPKDAPKPQKQPDGKERYVANRAIGKQSIIDAKYTCEFCECKETFISRTTEKNYMEPHHLIPISLQGEFDKDIDRKSNIICLCPNCHSKIHYGKNDDVREMLEKFIEQRSAKIKQECKIDIDLKTLCNYYGFDITI